MESKVVVLENVVLQHVGIGFVVVSVIDITRVTGKDRVSDDVCNTLGLIAPVREAFGRVFRLHGSSQVLQFVLGEKIQEEFIECAHVSDMLWDKLATLVMHMGYNNGFDAFPVISLRRY